jgi:hypothetical protein
MTDPETRDAALLSARGISKQFAGVEVLSDVDLDLMPREIHAFWARTARVNRPSPNSSPAFIARRADR